MLRFIGDLSCVIQLHFSNILYYEQEGKLARAKTAFELCQEVTPCKAFSTAIEKVGAMEYDSALRIALKGRTAAIVPDVKKQKEEPEEDIPTVLSGIIDRIWDIVAHEENVDEFEEEVRDILEAILYGHEVLQLYKHGSTSLPDRQRLLDDLANVGYMSTSETLDTFVLNMSRRCR